ncbi:hypothetical protein Fmac_008041 [Flemingia macrophylla]|uniref:Uncharacterized protein n=1 Tax=Flemingia macrophylla TaxID=520843 RepID=A0ABD1MWB9_9FABA
MGADRVWCFYFLLLSVVVRNKAIVVVVIDSNSICSNAIFVNQVVLEEKKEVDTTTGQASHRITRGIYDKGHSVIRKLHLDGKVDIKQTLHNLNEDELARFEETWKGSNMAQLLGYDVHKNEEPPPNPPTDPPFFLAIEPPPTPANHPPTRELPPPTRESPPTPRASHPYTLANHPTPP